MPLTRKPNVSRRAERAPLSATAQHPPTETVLLASIFLRATTKQECEIDLMF